MTTTYVGMPHIAAYVPALDSIETVNVVTNSFDAEQGLAGGSAINVQIKSGTNTFQGSAFEYHHNENLRARNYFAPPGTDKGDFRTTSLAARSADPSFGISCSSSRATRARSTARRSTPSGRCPPPRWSRRFVRVGHADLRPADRQRRRVGTHAVLEQTDSARADRSHRPVAH